MFDPMNGAITMTSVQNPDPPTQPIVGCGATTSGALTFGNDTGGDFAAMSMTSSSYGPQNPDPPPGMHTPLTLPGLLRFIAAAASFLPSTAPDTTLPLPDITLPVNVNKLEVHVPADGPATAVVTCAT